MNVIKTILAVIGCCSICMCIIHRRVIKAIMNGESIPQAPTSHVWVKNRKEKKNN